VDRLDTIQTYVRVVECGSFSAAARELRVGQSAVSKQIAALEAWLGTELIWRSSRTLTMTEVGKEFYESSIRLLEDFEAATSRVQRGHAAPKGLIRLMASPTFSRHFIAPRMPEFLALYPDITLELVVSNTPTNLIEDGIDISIHGFELSDSNLIVKKIAETSIVTVATPTYLEKHGVPKRPSELDRHFGVIFLQQGTPREWLFEDNYGRSLYLPKSRFRTNDGEHIRTAVLAHLGMTNAPAWQFAREIASGAVCRILTKYERPRSIFALRPGGRRLATKVRLLIEFLETTLASDLATPPSSASNNA
jgi:LysR family transcriptional regulator, regulator for bpeEF and oprC